MKLIIPFEKKVKFNSNACEISSISLEHEFTKNEGEILGNFLISGSYKEHELSVNKTPFNFTLPFSVDISDRVDLDTIEFTIDNFTYDLKDNDLDIKIDYVITGEDKKEEVRFEKVEDEEILPILEDNEINDREIIEEKTTDEEKDIISSIEAKDDYMMYHLHIVKETETIESICTLYGLSKDEILNINNITNVNVNDKLLIPINE